jgi:hypothetical protein
MQFHILTAVKMISELLPFLYCQNLSENEDSDLGYENVYSGT